MTRIVRSNRLNVAAAMFAVIVYTGMRPPGFDPVVSMDEIVVARVVSYEDSKNYFSTVILDVEEILKGSLSIGRIRAVWIPAVPPGCDTEDCVRRAYANPRPRPKTGEKIITMMTWQHPSGMLDAHQEFTYPFSQEKRNEISQKMKSR